MKFSITRIQLAWVVLGGVLLLAACGDSTPVDQGPDPDSDPPVALSNLVAIEAGAWHTCALDEIGRASCWGRNNVGQLGRGDWGEPPNPDPAPVAQGSGVFASIELGEDHTCVLDPQREISCWGGDGSRQLGYFSDDSLETCGTTPCSTFPRPVIDGTRFGTLATGYGFTCAATSLGTPYCWGDNRLGQGGNGGTGATIPYAWPVTGQHLFALVAAGDGNACGISTDGVTYCWGEADKGQLGTTEDCLAFEGICPIPSRVAVPVTLVALAIGGSHTCGLSADGTAYCWGGGEDGALGTGGTSDEPLPVAVNTPVRFSSLAAGGRHTCGLSTTGAVYCWGANDVGQLGVGTAAPALLSTPTRVDGAATYVDVAAGTDHSCAVTPDGRAYCWGSNRYGQLGDGTTQDRNTPVEVGA